MNLRALEHDGGFLIRTASEGVPPGVGCRLSPLGESLMAEIGRVMDWVRANRTAIEKARAAFNAEPA